MENNKLDLNLDLDSEKLKRRVYLNLLYDFYSPLLTERQRNVYELIEFSDLAPAETARALGVSRQAVHILQQRIIKRLESIEKKLHFAETVQKLEARIKALEDENERLRKDLNV